MIVIRQSSLGTSLNQLREASPTLMPRSAACIFTRRASRHRLLRFHPSPAFVLVILSFYRMVSASATAWARTGRGLGMGHQLGQRFAELSERVGRSVGAHGLLEESRARRLADHRRFQCPAA